MYRKRNDEIFNLMKDQFTSKDGFYKELEQKQKQYMAEHNKRMEETDTIRRKARKDQEMQVKLFQDMQVSIKQKTKDQELSGKTKDLKKEQMMYAKFREEDAAQKQKVRTKNKEHQNLVVEQMKEEPRTFAKTGIAIIMK